MIGLASHYYFKAIFSPWFTYNLSLIGCMPICNGSQDIWGGLQFSWRIAKRGKVLISIFSSFSASINKIFNLEEDWILEIFLTFPKSYVVWLLVTRLVYTMFINNNRASFHMW